MTLSTPCDWTCQETRAKPSRFKGFLSSVLREIQLRRAMREIGALDDAALLDMGIGRGSIEDAVRHGRG